VSTKTTAMLSEIMVLMLVPSLADVGRDCMNMSECPEDGQNVQNVFLLQQRLALAAKTKPATLSVPFSKTNPALHAHERMADPEFVLAGALAAGLPWTLHEAVRQVDRMKGISLLSKRSTKQGRGSKLKAIADECREMNEVVNFNGCLSSLSVVTGMAGRLFFQTDSLTLQDAYTMTSGLVIESLNMFFPILGMITGIINSYLTTSFFPGSKTDPYFAAMEQLAEAILDQAATAATSNLLATTMASHVVELQAISQDVQTMTDMITSEDSSTEAQTVLFTFNLVMLHSITKLGMQIRQGALADIAGSQWSYEIFALATQVAELESVLQLQIADHELTDKASVNYRLHSIWFGSGGWSEWFEEHYPKAVAYIDDAFDKCNMDMRLSHFARGSGVAKTTETGCSASHVARSSDCQNVLGMNLYTEAECKIIEADYIMVYEQQGSYYCYTSCSECDGDVITPLSLREGICSNCNRDAVRNKMLNHFEVFAFQWRGLAGLAGGAGQFKKDQFDAHNGKQACAGGNCNPITSVVDRDTKAKTQVTFSECWEECFSNEKCEAIEVPHCKDHSSMVNVGETGYDGFYFFFEWNDWMTDGKNRVRQCRDGVQIWEGEVRTWNRMWDESWGRQTLGDSHGRREPYDEAAHEQWQTGDKIYPTSVACGQEECPSQCANHGSLVNVRGIAHSSNEDGKYFNFQWNNWKDWMKNWGHESGSGLVLSVRQCRSGNEVWQGDVQVWNSLDSSQVEGDSHGRRAEGAEEGQWQKNDKIYPSQYACNDKMCTCNLVTGLGNEKLSFGDAEGWSVYTVKAHGPSTVCNA